ncbi:MAG: formate/nitrite transporter family protein, partial [Faecalibacterium sp.]|nr:formate/nitrite transporter family protein [Faecalibacterium sp.]
LAVAFMFHFAGLSSAAATAAYTAATALAKTTAAPTVLFWKGVLCNLCVCLAVWCAAKMKSESGKLIMVVWCILIFMLCGFEHSVANMSIIPLGLLTGAEGVTLAGFAKNLLFVTVGNFTGGFGCVALPYWFISKQK